MWIDWLAANAGSLAVGAVLVLVVALVVVLLVRDKKKGKKTCSCGNACAGCALAGQCHASKKE